MKTFLAVDDNPDDLFLLERTLSLAGIEHRLLTAVDGVEAEGCMKSLASAHHSALPSIVFLEIDMPRRNGFVVLDWFKRQPRFAAIPLVIVSASDNRADIDGAFKLGAAAWLPKPPDPRAVGELVELLTNPPSTAGEVKRTEMGFSAAGLHACRVFVRGEEDQRPMAVAIKDLGRTPGGEGNSSVRIKPAAGRAKDPSKG